MIRAKKLRIAARKLLDKKKLPDDFPQDWRDWLDGIESDGSHPDDSKLIRLIKNPSRFGRRIRSWRRGLPPAGESRRGGGLSP